MKGLGKPEWLAESAGLDIRRPSGPVQAQLQTMTILVPSMPKGPACWLATQTRRGPLHSNGPSRGFLSGGSFQHRGSLNNSSAERGALVHVRSSSHDMASNENDFDLSKYRLAEITAVRQELKPIGGQAPQWLIILKLSETNNALAVYVGDFEGNSLRQELPPHDCTPKARPMTHDMMKHTLAALGARVTKVCITALIQNTYHARVHYAREGSTEELIVDSRPSDALNLAIRFGAPVYINKSVAEKMASPMGNFERKSEVPAEIIKSCKEALKRYHDPTVVHKVNLQVAIEENRFEDAAKIRNQIEKLLSGDRTLSLVVAMESALEDKRWDEAAFLRNELTALIDQVPEQKLQDA